MCSGSAVSLTENASAITFQWTTAGVSVSSTNSTAVKPLTMCSIGKALVVCPVSLVENWKKEFTKWLDQLADSF
jgi:SNF2 family DNA or RNA helicase